MAFVGKGSGEVYEYIQSTLAFARRHSVGNQPWYWVLLGRCLAQ